MASFSQVLDQLMDPDACGDPSSNSSDMSQKEGYGRSQTGFAGVTLHKRTQRYEAHIWAEKKQIYLGSYNIKGQAARVHDIMAFKVKPPPASTLNYPEADYQEMRPLLEKISQSDLVLKLREYGKSLSPNGRPSASPPPRAEPAAPAPAAVASPSRPPLPPLAQAALLTVPAPILAASNPVSSVPSPQRAVSPGLNTTDPSRRGRRKQSRPSSALDSYPAWPEESPPASSPLLSPPKLPSMPNLMFPTQFPGINGNVTTPTRPVLPLFVNPVMMATLPPPPPLTLPAPNPTVSLPGVQATGPYGLRHRSVRRKYDELAAGIEPAPPAVAVPPRSPRQVALAQGKDLKLERNHDLETPKLRQERERERDL